MSHASEPAGCLSWPSTTVSNLLSQSHRMAWVLSSGVKELICHGVDVAHDQAAKLKHSTGTGRAKPIGVEMWERAYDLSLQRRVCSVNGDGAVCC